MPINSCLLNIKELYSTPAFPFLFIRQVELGVFFHTLNMDLPPLPSALYSFSWRLCSSANISHLSSFIPHFSLLISPSRVLLLHFQQPDGLCLRGWAANISVSSFPDQRILLYRHLLQAFLHDLWLDYIITWFWTFPVFYWVLLVLSFYFSFI